MLTIPPLITETERELLQNLIANAKRILICGHRGPDGDAVGSALGWADYLKRLGKETVVMMPNPFPDFLRWLPGIQDISFYMRHETEATQAIKNCDLVFCLDFNALHRLMEMGDVIAAHDAPRVIIDHHRNPDRNAAALTMSHPQMCSTCEVVLRLLLQLGGYEDMATRAATALYTGMMTDTGGFTYNSNSPEIYQLISLLLAKGIDKDKIYRNVFNTYSESRLRLTGYILYKKLDFYQDRRASIFTLTRSEMTRFNFIRGDAEGLVNMPLQVKGMRLSISLREDTERDVVRVSLRSVDDFPCNKMAEEFFNGGLHLNASGGEPPFPLSEAVKTAERAIEAYAHLL